MGGGHKPKSRFLQSVAYDINVIIYNFTLYFVSAPFIVVVEVGDFTVTSTKKIFQTEKVIHDRYIVCFIPETTKFGYKPVPLLKKEP